MSLSEFFILILLVNTVFLSSVWLSKGKKDSLTQDFFFQGCSIILMACSSVLLIFYFNNQEIELRQWLTALLLTIIGTRLAITKTSIPEKEKKFFNKSALASYLREVCSLSLLLTLLIAPAISINFLPGSAGFSFLDFLGLVVFILGLSIENKSNKELRAFRSLENNSSALLKKGLWAFSRHPNYLGTLIQWWSIYFIALNALGGYWSLFGPIILTVYFNSFIRSKEALLTKKISSYKEYKRTTNRFIPDLLVFLQFILPKRFLNSFFRLLTSSKKSIFKTPLIRIFCFFYKPDMSESELLIPTDYSSFNHFFTRKLKPESRNIDTNPESIISPVDGKITDFGYLSKSRLVQAKKFSYSLEGLLKDKKVAKRFEDGFFASIYLAPHNHHRIYFPQKASILKTDFIKGSLFGVNDRSQRNIPNLYNRNERAWVYLEASKFEYLVVCVGALLVGRIIPYWIKSEEKEKNKLSDIWKKGPQEKKAVEKGQELGFFEMGSTVILIFSKDLNLNKHVLSENKSVKFGETLLTI